MRRLRSVLLLTGALGGLTLGCGFAFLGWQVSLVAGAAQPTPRTLSVAELIEKGPGGNLHVELTDFTFGPPVAEPKGAAWEGVWVPLQPTWKGSTPPKRNVILWAAGVRDQAELDELLGQKSVTALVTTKLPFHSPWKVSASKTLRRANQQLDAVPVIFLSLRPNLEVAGVTVLTEDQIYAESTAGTAWGLAAGLLVLGVVCVFLMSRGSRRAAPAGPAAPPDEHARGRLAIENPLSSHRFNFWGAVAASGKFIAVTLFCLVAGLVCWGAAFWTIDKGKTGGAVGGFVFGVIFFLLAWRGWRNVKKLFGGVTELAVCPSGLRWTKGGQHRMALWTEIARVHRDVYVVSRRGEVTQRTDVFTVYFPSGETLEITHEALTDYPRFANAVPGLHEADVKGKNFGRLTQDWRQAFALPRAGETR
jgi:hypothetical protein